MDLILLLIAAAAMMIGATGLVYYFRPEKRVELLRPRDSRGQVLRVSQETDLGLMCKKVKGVTHRFIKVGRGWTFSLGGKMVTKFFGIEGKAYTGIPRDSGPVEVPVSEYLKWLWGEKFYNVIPEEQRRTVETEAVGIIVAIDPIEEEEHNLPTISADDIHDQDDNVMLGRLARSSGDRAGPRSILNYVLAFTLGLASMFFLVTKGLV